MKKILHVCVDEKFIDYAINSFNSIEGFKSSFVVISSNKKLKYIKSTNVIIQTKFSFIFSVLTGKIKSYDAIVFHSMQEIFKLFIKFIPSKINICWIGFGFDYYEKCKSIPESEHKVQLLKDYFKKRLLQLESSYKKIDFFSPVLESEFLPVVTRLNLNVEYIDWNYGSSNALIHRLKNDFVIGDSILLGNSADPTNNHIEIIHELISQDEKREVVIPLSYGGNKSYISSVLNLLESSRLNYTVLQSFMRQSEYFKVLKRCSFVIMNHRRQQALGNIIMMLSLGAKVIIRKDNPVCSYLNCLGFEFVEKNNLETDLSQLLPQEVIMMNKNLTLKHFNDDVIKRKTDSLVNIICKRRFT